MSDFEITTQGGKWHLREPGATIAIMEFDSRQEAEAFFQLYRTGDEQPVRVAFFHAGGQVEERVFKPKG